MDETEDLKLTVVKENKFNKLYDIPEAFEHSDKHEYNNSDQNTVKDQKS